MSAMYHIPVMGREVCDYLIVKHDAVVYDGTVGGGGHAELILNKLTDQALYIAVDRDPEAIQFAKNRLNRYPNVCFYQGTFDKIEDALNTAHVAAVDVIFLDLGISSQHLQNHRGFTFQSDTGLDMRMDKTGTRTAENILSTYDEEALTRVFKTYGEERHSRKIARRIVKERHKTPLKSTRQLVEIIKRSVSGKQPVKSYARIFQALRIEVNDELDILKRTLDQAPRFLKKRGRVGVLTYNSLEDRIVKQFLKDSEHPCTCPPELPYCICGKKAVIKRIKPLFIEPSAEEVAANAKARSAKLRIGEKI